MARRRAGCWRQSSGCSSTPDRRWSSSTGTRTRRWRVRSRLPNFSYRLPTSKRVCARLNRAMPEETNRVLTDHVSSLLFAPSDTALANLAAEGVRTGVIRTGDVMLDVVEQHREAIRCRADEACAQLGVSRNGFAFATVHRPENTDSESRWSAILGAFAEIGLQLPILWAAHPRTRALVDKVNLPGVVILDPQPYSTQALVSASRLVLTDSGGLQKEAAFHRVPCVTLRDSTEWVELVESGVNTLAGADRSAISNSVAQATWPPKGLPDHLYGDGRSAVPIARAIAEHGCAAPGMGVL